MTNWLDRHLVPDWRESWRFASVQNAAVASAVGGVVTASPDILLALVSFLPDGHWARIAIIAAVVITLFIVPTIARLWNQEAGDDDAAQ